MKNVVTHLGVRSHEHHESDEAQVFQVLVRVLYELAEMFSAKLDNLWSIGRFGPILLLREG